MFFEKLDLPQQPYTPFLLASVLTSASAAPAIRWDHNFFRNDSIGEYQLTR